MVKGYDFETGKFIGRFNDVKFDLDIRKPIVQIMGDSATGKTLLVNYLKADKLSAKYNGISDYPDVYVFDINSPDIDISGLQRKLIVIDRGDLILQDSLIDKIRTDRNNSYLIFARMTLPLGLSPNYYGEFKVSDGNVISIAYLFSEVGWF